MKGLLRIHNPSLIITVADIDVKVRDALILASSSNQNASTLIQLPRLAVPKVLWMADLRSTALKSKKFPHPLEGISYFTY
jgi:hypothetical protein